MTSPQMLPSHDFLISSDGHIVMRDIEKTLFYDLRKGVITIPKDCNCLRNYCIAAFEKQGMHLSDGAILQAQRQLHNRIMIEQKIVKLERRLAEKVSTGEKKALEWIKADLTRSHRVRPSRNQVRAAIIATLKAWQESPELAQKELQEVDLVRKCWKAELRAYGATNSEMASFLKDLSSIHALWENTVGHIQKKALDLKATFKALQYLPELERESIFDDFMVRCPEILCAQITQGQQRYTHLANNLRSGVYRTTVTVRLNDTRCRFLERWQPYLKQELSQKNDNLYH